MTATKTKQHENKAKFAGHHQIPILFASNVHNHHDFYFIVSPYCLNHKYYYFKQTNKQKRKKNLTTVTIIPTNSRLMSRPPL